MKYSLRILRIVLFLIFSACSYLDVSQYSSLPSEEVNELLTDREDSSFYYYFDKKIPYDVKENLVLVQLKDNIDKDLFISKLQEQYKFTINTHYPLRNNVIILESESYPFQANFLEELNSISDVNFATYMIVCNKSLLSPSNRFTVQLRKSSDYTTLQDVAEKYACKIVKKSLYNPYKYILEVTKDCEYSAIELANIFQESNLYAYTSPELYFFSALNTQDTYYSLQWGLKNTGQYGLGGIDINIEQAWNISNGGEGVVVAVIDNGVELSHPDLRNQLLPGYDVINNITQGGEIENSGQNIGHGTAVAGIIAAEGNNNEGVSGVAPHSKIIPIRAFGLVPYSPTYVADAIDIAVAEGADVINCSFGDIAEDADITTSINNAATNGRNGKGCVIVVSSGNQNGPITYPSMLGNVIAVGAHRFSGSRLPSSNYGQGLDVVAPGEKIATTDRLGSFGYNTNGELAYPVDFPNKDYTKYFDGTSAAAAFVSGIAALILARYPDLTQAQVRRAIELGCVRPSGYTYQNDNRTPVGLWNNQVGYGRVDAYAALQKADVFHQENVANSIPGIDFEITNESSYTISNIYVGLTGTINGESTMFFSCDPGNLDPNQSIGFPTYREEDIDATPGTTISDLELEIYAECPDYSGNLRVSATIDVLASIDLLSFDTGMTYYMPIADTTVPYSSRKKVYIHIMDPLN